ncbi:vomeronasal type-1 receptor 3-like [Castor canadensis]|uniref:Vomeronasal type-1 receptor 3-like n=1 Tax=Castor canadensis TaxID=51338 RepID=A0AC58L8J6_CASCN
MVHATGLAKDQLLCGFHTCNQSKSVGTVTPVALKTALLFHSGVGTVANVILFFHNVSPLLVGHRLRPTQVLFTHLASANTLVLLSTGIPHSMVAFVPRNSLSSLGCKLTYYIHQMGHTATLCSTCVLSIYQAVTVIPMNAGRIIIKGKAQEITRPSCYTCWMFSTLINVYIPMRVTGLQDKHNYTDTEVQWFCSSLGPSVGFVILLFISKATFIGLTGSASGSMVLLLCRHHKRKQHIHTSNLYHKGPPESRAAHTILMLRFVDEDDEATISKHSLDERLQFFFMNGKLQVMSGNTLYLSVF